jgi:hypothetical protein
VTADQACPRSSGRCRTHWPSPTRGSLRRSPRSTASRWTSPGRTARGARAALTGGSPAAPARRCGRPGRPTSPRPRAVHARSSWPRCSTAPPGSRARPVQHRDAVRLAAADLDPHASVRDHHGDRDRFTGPRAAVDQAVGHHLADQENRHVSARMRRAEHAAHEHAGLAHLIWPARERHTLPNRRPSHPRTRPSPAVRPQTLRISNQTQEMHARLSRQRLAGTRPPDWPPVGHTRARSGQAASPHTAPWPEFPSAMCPVGSGRGALPALLPVGFPDLPAKPGVRFSPHRAFPVPCPLDLACACRRMGCPRGRYPRSAIAVAGDRHG